MDQLQQFLIIETSHHFFSTKKKNAQIAAINETENEHCKQFSPVQPSLLVIYWV